MTYPEWNYPGWDDTSTDVLLGRLVELRSLAKQLARERADLLVRVEVVDQRAARVEVVTREIETVVGVLQAGALRAAIVAACPVDDACSWRSPTQDGVEAHVRTAHPEVYTRDLYARWEKA